MEMDDGENCNNAEKFLSLKNTATGPQWKVTSEKESDILMKNSVPWKLDAVCNLEKNKRLCYDTLYDNKKSYENKYGSSWILCLDCEKIQT